MYFSARSLARHRHMHRPLPHAVPGPVLAVVQQTLGRHAANQKSFDWQNDTLGLGRVFEDIARQMDCMFARAAIGDGAQLVVGLSDVSWRGRVLIAVYDVADLKSLMNASIAISADFTCSLARNRSNRDVQSGRAANLGYISAVWSELARKSMRKADTRHQLAPDFIVGEILATNSATYQSIREIAANGPAPALMIALNSTGTARARLKCRLGAFAVEVPEWARPSGSVAGHA